MNSPKFISLLIVPEKPNPVRLAGFGETLREVENSGLLAWQAESQLGSAGEPPMWETYIRVRDVVQAAKTMETEDGPQ